jgi:hypothetical protein
MVIVIMAVILALTIALGVVTLLSVKKRAREGKTVQTSYSSLYTLGKIMVPFSIVMMAVMFVFQIPFYIGLPFLMIGLTYLIVGRININRQKE